MRDFTMFNYNFLFGDHFAKVSNQAKLYYIKLCFYADRGFVPNPMSVLDSLGFDKGVYWELVRNDEILTLPDRCEVFLTSYFLHNPGLKSNEIGFSPYWVYWRGKLHLKKNGVATFNPQGVDSFTPNPDPLANVETPTDVTPKPVQPSPLSESVVPSETDEERWNRIMNELDNK